MGRSSLAKSINTLVFYLSLALLLYSFMHRNDFPTDHILAPAINSEPTQKKTRKQPFTFDYNEIQYEIIPQYNYDLTGLVVSYEHHSGESMIHKMWNDHINVADLCVVWMQNASDVDLNEFSFFNGQFTCNFETYNMVEWEKFQQDQISNNHLLSNDPEIRKVIEKVRIGDQIRLRGWLSRYTNNLGFNRGTSITRDDEGNGACETIYLEEFEIIKQMNTVWRKLVPISFLVCMFCAFIWFRGVLKGDF